MTNQPVALPATPVSVAPVTSTFAGAPRTEPAQRKWARVAGVLYLVITIAAIVAHFYVPAQIIVPNDLAATAANIVASDTLFRVGIGSEFIVLLAEIVLSVILYTLFRPVNRTVSLTAAVSRLVMTTIHGLNLLNYFFILSLLGGAGFAAAFTPEQIHALVGLFLDAHSYGFTIGIAFLTIHVFALGYLIVKSGYVPKIIGILFIVAGFGYLIDSFGLLLFSGYTTTPVYVAVPIAVAEIAFPLWLLVMGIKVSPQQAEGVASINQGAQA